jgi:hypothetical protein
VVQLRLLLMLLLMNMLCDGSRRELLCISALEH